MGYNRSGTRRKQRLKRCKREHERLAAKAAHAGEGGGLVDKVVSAAKGVAGAVKGAVGAVVDAVRGHKER